MSSQEYEYCWRRNFLSETPSERFFEQLQTTPQSDNNQFLLCSYPNWIYIRLGSWNIKTCEYVSGTGECVKGSIDSPIIVSNNETLKSDQNTKLTNASVTDARRCNIMCKHAEDCKSTHKNSPKVKNCLVFVQNKQGGNGPVDETELDLCGHATRTTASTDAYCDYLPNEWTEEGELAYKPRTPSRGSSSVLVAQWSLIAVSSSVVAPEKPFLFCILWSLIGES